MDVYHYITKDYIPSLIEGDALRRSKTKCNDYLVIGDVSFKMKVYKNENRTFIPLVIAETYAHAILYHHHNSLLAGNQCGTTMCLTLNGYSILAICSIQSESM